MYEILIKGGEVIDPAQGLADKRDIAICDGKITELGVDLPAKEAKKVEDALAIAKKALEEHTNNSEELQKTTDTLMQASHKVAELLYQQAQQAEAQKKENPDKKADDEPIEGEINK